MGVRPVVRSDPDERPFEMVRCTACGLVQQFPREPAAAIESQYGEAYDALGGEEPSRWARAVQQYALHIQRWETPRYRRLLDMGCAGGHLAALANRRGWHVVGIDISPEIISGAAVRLGLDFRAGLLSRHRLTLPPFDLVFLGDVLEHVPEPSDFLRDVRGVLSPGGVVCIDTPNWAGRWRRWGRSHWLGLNRYHINLFDAASLSRLLASCGFVDAETGSYTNYRYESWAHRPEPQAFIGKMPRPLAWRVNRFLERRIGRSPWSILCNRPPASLDEALAMLDEVAPLRESLKMSSPAADNLVAAARRR